MNREIECNCGSGLEREAEYDGYGIFLTFVCDQCRADKMKRFRDDIKERYECDEPIEEDY